MEGKIILPFANPNAKRLREICLNWPESDLERGGRPEAFPRRPLPPGRKDAEASLSLMGHVIPSRF